jgi:hypothetical protein
MNLEPPYSTLIVVNGVRAIINRLIIVKTSFYKIPPNLPLPKGGIIPLFGKEG